MRTVDEQHDRLQSSVAAFEEGPTPGGVAYLQAQALTSIALELRELRQTSKCGALSFGKEFTCTRPLGHDGEHVAVEGRFGWERHEDLPLRAAADAEFPSAGDQR